MLRENCFSPMQISRGRPLSCCYVSTSSEMVSLVSVHVCLPAFLSSFTSIVVARWVVISFLHPLSLCRRRKVFFSLVHRWTSRQHFSSGIQSLFSHFPSCSRLWKWDEYRLCLFARWPSWARSRPIEKPLCVECNQPSVALTVPRPTQWMEQHDMDWIAYPT